MTNRMIYLVERYVGDHWVAVNAFNDQDDAIAAYEDAVRKNPDWRAVRLIHILADSYAPTEK